MNEKICFEDIINFPKYTNFSIFFLKIMENIGVHNIIGLPGEDNLDIYYAMNYLKMKNSMIRNEMNGGYIAVGSSRSSIYNVSKRNLTICYCTVGPGLANMVNPISAATLEHVPTIFITATQESKLKNNRLIQDIQSVKIIENICKSYLEITEDDIKNGKIIKKMHDTLVKGFSYPRGAIVFIFKNDTASLDASKYLKKLNYFIKLFSIFEGDYKCILKEEIRGQDVFTGLYDCKWSNIKKKFMLENNDKIVNIKYCYDLIKTKLEKSHSPLMLIGMGAIDYIYELLDFCRNAEIPYIVTLPLCGYGNIDDEYYAFRMGHTGTYCGNTAIQHCDFLITWGTSLNIYTVVNLNDENFKHINCVIDINKNPELYYKEVINNYIIGDGKDILNKINKKGIIHSIKRPDWLKKINKFKIKGFKLNDYYYSKNENEMLKQGDIYSVLQSNVDIHLKNNNKKVFFIADAGLSQPFTATYIHYKTKNYYFITSSKYGSIGSALGEAIGFSINNPNDLIICICGDSATLDAALSDYISLKEMNINNIIFIIIENSGCGFISAESKEESNLLLNYGNGYKYFPNWKNMFESLLIDSYVVKNLKDMKDATKCAFNNLYKKCTVLICVVPYDAYYSPTIRLNGKFSEMVFNKFNENSEINRCRYKQI
jgi:acetolactate synthase-1/2/3 large subunit